MLILSRQFIYVLKLIFAIGLLGLSSTLMAEDELNPYAPPGKFVYVGSHVMYIDCMGKHSPTVLIEVGLGDSSANWYKLAEKLSAYTRVCVYDRAGYGWSNTGPGERTTAQITHELNTLLEQAQVPGPYVVVGHSFGGFTARYFATRFPEKTLGVVLVESSHPDQVTRLAALDTQTPSEPLKIARMEGPPEHMSEFESRWFMLNTSRKAIVAQMSELEGFRQSAEQVQELGPMPPVPLAVLTRGVTQLPVIDDVSLEQEWQQMQADLLTLSPHSWQEIIPESGHSVHKDAPDKIIANILKVIVRSNHNQQANNRSYYYSGQL